MKRSDLRAIIREEIARAKRRGRVNENGMGKRRSQINENNAVVMYRAYAKKYPAAAHLMAYYMYGDNSHDNIFARETKHHKDDFYKFDYELGQIAFDNEFSFRESMPEIEQDIKDIIGKELYHINFEYNRVYTG
jgi:hypothetical protein